CEKDARRGDRRGDGIGAKSLAARHIDANNLAWADVEVEWALADSFRVSAVVVRPIGVGAEVHGSAQSRQRNVRASLHVAQHFARQRRVAWPYSDGGGQGR